LDPPKSFINKVDSLILNKDNDPELAEGLNYIDKKCQESGQDVYQVIMQYVYKDYIKTRTKEWINTKNV